mmetsp:Transcript_37196/g.86739  ORF Transcript_37196/g.86739 Transcript_37196/m.86739 type:complete len:262 (+) Transcript_37196:5076-5861(+)
MVLLWVRDKFLSRARRTGARKKSSWPSMLVKLVSDGGGTMGRQPAGTEVARALADVGTPLPHPMPVRGETYSSSAAKAHPIAPTDNGSASLDEEFVAFAVDGGSGMGRKSGSLRGDFLSTLPLLKNVVLSSMFIGTWSTSDNFLPRHGIIKFPRDEMPSGVPTMYPWRSVAVTMVASVLVSASFFDLSCLFPIKVSSIVSEHTNRSNLTLFLSRSGFCIPFCRCRLNLHRSTISAMASSQRPLQSSSTTMIKSADSAFIPP